MGGRGGALVRGKEAISLSGGPPKRLFREAPPDCTGSSFLPDVPVHFFSLALDSPLASSYAVSPCQPLWPSLNTTPARIWCHALHWPLLEPGNWLYLSQTGLAMCPASPTPAWPALMLRDLGIGLPTAVCLHLRFPWAVVGWQAVTRPCTTPSILPSAGRSSAHRPGRCVH